MTPMVLVRRVKGISTVIVPMFLKSGSLEMAACLLGLRNDGGSVKSITKVNTRLRRTRRVTGRHGSGDMQPEGFIECRIFTVSSKAGACQSPLRLCDPTAPVLLRRIL